MTARGRSMPRWAAALAIGLVVASIGAWPAAAATPPPTIVLSVTAGAAGTTFVITGTGYAPGTTYGLCMMLATGSKCGYEGQNIAAPSQFTAAADGTIPPSTIGEVPDFGAGDYVVLSLAPGTAATVASARFTVTAPTLSIAPVQGAGGTVATVTLTGGAPNTAYTVCLDPVDQPACGYVGIDLGSPKTDATGAFPAGMTITIPGQPAGPYHIGIKLPNGGLATLIATATFTEVPPTLSFTPTEGPSGTQQTFTGSGYQPGGGYELCLVPADADTCGGVGIIVAGFHADPTGNIPPGTIAAIPPTTPGPARIGVRVLNSTANLIVWQSLTIDAGTAPPPTSTSAAPAIAGVTPAPASGRPASTGSDSGFPLLLLLVILLLIVLAVAFWWSRRRREPDKPASAQ
jgi:hypothetical protein